MNPNRRPRVLNLTAPKTALRPNLEAPLVTCIEQLPSSDLRPFVECIWYSAPSEGVAFDIVPDGCVDVCFVMSENDPRVLLFGTTTQTSSYYIEPGAPHFGVRFRPGMASLFVGERIADLTDSRVRIGEFLGCSAEEFQDPISFRTRRQRLETLLKSALARADVHPSRVIGHAVSAINVRRGDIKVRDVAAECSLSERQLERLFLERVGVPPKLYARIQRFRSVLDHLDDPAEPGEVTIADVAAMHGYTDQSHLIRDFKRFAHELPAVS